MRSVASLLSAARGDLRIFSRMLLAYRRGEYRRVPWAALGAIAGAIVYLVLPLDLIPDFILGLGILDDATIVGLALGAIRREIGHFARWEELRGRRSGAGPPSIARSADSEAKLPPS